MKQLKRLFYYNLAGYTVSLMYSYGIAVSLIITHFLDISTWDAFKYTALILLIFTVLFYNKWTSLAALISASAYVYWAIRYQGAVDWVLEKAPPFFGAVLVFLRGQEPLPAEYHLPLGLMFIVATVLFSRISASRLRGTPSMVIVCAAVFVTEWSLGHHNVILPMALSATAIASVYAYSFARHLFLRDMSDAEEDYTEEDELFAEGETVKTERRTIRIPNATAIAAFAVPLALVASLSATLVIPSSASQFRSPAVEIVVDDVVDYIGQFTGFSRKLYSFSISSFGYTSSNKLGGPVRPSKDLAMVVEGISPTLLRGSTKTQYTGKGWTNTGNLGSYRYSSALWGAKRSEVFDLDRPDTEIINESNLLYRNVRLRIRPSQNFYTIFSPTRPFSVLSSDKSFIPYFNDIGELYPKRKIQYGTSYTIQARQISNLSGKVSDYIVELEQTLPPEDEEKMEEIRKLYLQLPSDLPASVKNDAERIASSAESDSPFLRAMAIKNYLMTNFTYTLSPSPVPENRDFVDYFLQTGKGYCTYFASAMAVMARAIGIPARYTEGFLLTNLGHDDNVYNVTGEQAHAWAELYFEGIGWIPFDSTPIGQPQTIRDQTPSQPVQPEIPTPSPTPSIAPDIVAETPPSETPLWLIATIAVAAVIILNTLLVVGHRIRYSKKRLLRKHSAGAAVEIWWRSILDMLPYQDKMFLRRDGETTSMLANRIGSLVQCNVCTFDQLVRIILRSYYSQSEPTDTEIDVVFRYFKAMENRMMKIVTPPVFAFMRILLPRAFGFRGQNRPRH